MLSGGDRWGLKHGETTMKYEVLKGSVQGQAKRDNRDASFVRELSGDPAGPILVAGVADGVSQCPFGGAVARWFCRHMMESPIPVSTPEALAADIVRLIGERREAFAAEFQQSEDFARSSCTLALCAIAGNTLHAFWAGDSPIMLSRKVGDSHETEVLTKRDVDRFGHLTDHFGAGGPHSVKIVSRVLQAGDTVTLASDGFAQIWDPGSISGVYAESAFGSELVKQLLDYGFRDDATFVAIRIR